MIDSDRLSPLPEQSLCDPGQRDDAAALVAFLSERDVPCPLCRYNLRGLLSPRCPECGRDLDLRVGLTEPRQAAWLTGQIALTAAAGVGVMIALVSLASGWPTESPRQPLLNFAFIMHLLMIPVATAWLVWRRRYMRLPRAIQWVGAGVAIATVAAGMVLLAMITD